jgi:hypothetical protein
MMERPLVYYLPRSANIRTIARQPRSCGKEYNIAVAVPASKPAPENHRQRHHHAYAAEATGLVLMALVLLILTVVRYWSYINWSMR